MVITSSLISFIVLLIGVLLVILSAFNVAQARASGKEGRGVSLWNLGWGLILFVLLIVGNARFHG